MNTTCEFKICPATLNDESLCKCTLDRIDRRNRVSFIDLKASYQLVQQYAEQDSPDLDTAIEVLVIAVGEMLDSFTDETISTKNLLRDCAHEIAGYYDEVNGGDPDYLPIMKQIAEFLRKWK